MCSGKSCQVGRKIIDDDYDDGFDEIKNHDAESWWQNSGKTTPARTAKWVQYNALQGFMI